MTFRATTRRSSRCLGPLIVEEQPFGRIQVAGYLLPSAPNEEYVVSLSFNFIFINAWRSPFFCMRRRLEAKLAEDWAILQKNAGWTCLKSSDGKTRFVTPGMKSWMVPKLMTSTNCIHVGYHIVVVLLILDLSV